MSKKRVLDLWFIVVVTKNLWHSTQDKSTSVRLLLADVVADHPYYTLVGHLSGPFPSAIFVTCSILNPYSSNHDWAISSIVVWLFIELSLIARSISALSTFSVLVKSASVLSRTCAVVCEASITSSQAEMVAVTCLLGKMQRIKWTKIKTNKAEVGKTTCWLIWNCQGSTVLIVQFSLLQENNNRAGGLCDVCIILNEMIFFHVLHCN